ncbi:MAG: hypothetical protein J6M60_05750 [Clostridia bacterium]|nr:hypothetical protein [Clostridia bacterium]
MSKIIGYFNKILTGSSQNRKEAIRETKKMIENIKFGSDKYDVDRRIDYLREKERVEGFKLNYKCFVTYDNLI